MTLNKKTKRAAMLTHAFNSCSPDEETKKEELLRELLGRCGQQLSIEHNFHCDLGYNIEVGGKLLCRIQLHGARYGKGHCWR